MLQVIYFRSMFSTFNSFSESFLAKKIGEGEREREREREREGCVSGGGGGGGHTEKQTDRQTETDGLSLREVEKKFV